MQEKQLTDCGHEPIRFACFRDKRMFCNDCFQKNHTRCLSSRCGNLNRMIMTLRKNVQIVKVKNKLVALGLGQSKLQSTFKVLNNRCEKFMLYINKVVENSLFTNLYPTINKMLETAFEVGDSDQDIAEIEREYTKIVEADHGKDTSQAQYFKYLSRNIEKMENKIKISDHKRKETIAQDKLDKLDKLMKDFDQELLKSFSLKKTISNCIVNKMRLLLDHIFPGTRPEYPSYLDLERFDEEDASSHDKIKYGVKCTNEALNEQPDALMSFSKHVLKERLYNQHLRSNSEGFPYTKMYLISTTAFGGNEDLEGLKLNLEKFLVANILSRTAKTESTKPIYAMTQRIVIMGPDLIDIRTQSHPQKNLDSTQVRIYWEADSTERENFIREILSILGLSKHSHPSPMIIRKKVLKFKNEVDKIYCFTRMVRSMIMDEKVEDEFLESALKTYTEEGAQFLRDQMRCI